MGRKKQYQPRTFESYPAIIDPKKASDTSANIYNSMLLSPAWMDLTPKQKELYLVCKAQMYGQKRRPKIDEENGVGKTAFFMNRFIWGDTYKLYKLGSNERAFYRDMNALIDHGFIRCVYSGQHNKSKSVYDYSDRWRWFGEPFFDIPANDKTPAMNKKARSKP